MMNWKPNYLFICGNGEMENDGSRFGVLFVGKIIMNYSERYELFMEQQEISY